MFFLPRAKSLSKLRRKSPREGNASAIGTNYPNPDHQSCSAALFSTPVSALRKKAARFGFFTEFPFPGFGFVASLIPFSGLYRSIKSQMKTWRLPEPKVVLQDRALHWGEILECDDHFFSSFTTCGSVSTLVFFFFDNDSAWGWSPCVKGAAAQLWRQAIVDCLEGLSSYPSRIGKLKLNRLLWATKIEL